jgi:hypothetical protein
MGEPKVPRTNNPREIQQWRLDLIGPNGLMFKVPGATNGNFAEFDDDGQVRDSGVSADQDLNKADDVLFNSVGVGFIDFDTDADPDMDIEGRMAWDEADHVQKVATGLGNVVQVSQELWGIGVNKTGGQATDGKVVYASGVQGNRLTYDYADARDGNKSGFVGVVTAPTDNNATGPVTTFGYVRNLDTSAWPEGTKLYIAANGSGTLTSTPPTPPDFIVLVANVTRQHITQGEIFVAPRIDIANGVVLHSLYLTAFLNLHEQSSDPADPGEGSARFWMSDGTDTGNDGDILFKEQSGAVIETGCLKHTDFTPASYTLNTGTLVAGDVTDVHKMFDGNTLDIGEVTGAPGYDIEFNFTNVDRNPRYVVCRWQYDGSATHFVTIDIYNYTTAAWDQIRVFKDSALYFDSLTMYLPINLNGDYVDGSGNAKLRFYHHTSGNASHDIHIDYVGLTHSLQGVI